MRGVGRNSQAGFLEIFEKMVVYTFCLYILGELFPLGKIFVFNSLSFSPVDETKKEMKANLFANSNALTLGFLILCFLLYPCYTLKSMSKFLMLF